MADVTKIADLKIFSWGRPTAANPRLAAPISSTATTITVTNAPLDETDAVVSTDFIMGVKNSDGYTESVLVPASGISTDGLTFTGVTRGIDVSGLDYTTGNSALAADHGQDSAVSCVVHPFNHVQWQAALQGTIASGGENWRIGNEADNDITVYAANGDANSPFWRYDSAGSKWVFSNDGVSSTDFGTGAGVTGGDGITVTAGDIDVDTTDTTVFVTTATADKVPLLNGSGQINAAQKGSTYTEENQALSGIGAAVTAANLDNLTDGSDASDLHVHDLKVITATRDMTAATGSVNYAHGLSTTPKKVRIDVVHSAEDSRCFGVWDGTTDSCIYEQGSTGATDASNTVHIYMAASAQGQTAKVSADGTNITLDWTKVSAPTGTAQLLITAEA